MLLPELIGDGGLVYSAKKYIGITSITVNLDGTEYTFTGIGGKDFMKDYDTNVCETPCIILGMNNMEFWLDLLLKFESLETKTDMMDMTFDVVLHGTKDIKATIEGTALLDCALIGEAYLSAAGIDALVEEEGTEMTVVYAETDDIATEAPISE